MDYSLLGKRIKAERQRKGLSQEQLSELISCSATHISHLENASTRMSLDVFVAIADALSVSPDKLLAGNAYQTAAVLTDEVAQVFSDVDPDTMYIMLESARSIKQAIATRQRTSSPL